MFSSAHFDSVLGGPRYHSHIHLNACQADNNNSSNQSHSDESFRNDLTNYIQHQSKRLEASLEEESSRFHRELEIIQQQKIFQLEEDFRNRLSLQQEKQSNTQRNNLELIWNRNCELEQLVSHLLKDSILMAKKHTALSYQILQEQAEKERLSNEINLHQNVCQRLSDFIQSISSENERLKLDKKNLEAELHFTKSEVSSLKQLLSSKEKSDVATINIDQFKKEVTSFIQLNSNSHNQKLPPSQEQDNIHPQINGDYQHHRRRRRVKEKSADKIQRHGRRIPKVKINQVGREEQHDDLKDQELKEAPFLQEVKEVMKVADQLCEHPGTEVLMIICSPAGRIFTFSTTKLHPILLDVEGKRLIARCLLSAEVT